jgi:hypothetical protein
MEKWIVVFKMERVHNSQGTIYAKYEEVPSKGIQLAFSYKQLVIHLQQYVIPLFLIILVYFIGLVHLFVLHTILWSFVGS